MKKQYIIILFILLPLSVNAQKSFKSEFAVGASYGMGGAFVSFSPKVYTKFLITNHFGLTGRWVTEKNLGLIVEVNYSQQGWAEEFAEPGYKYERTLNFIEIPFLTHIYFGGERFRFFFNLGPKIGYMIGESTSENVLGISPAPAPPVDEGVGYDQEQPQRGKEIDKKFAWGLCGGPGLELRTKIGIFQLEGRYYYGLGDLFNSKVSDDFSKSASQFIMGKVTYLIPLKKK